jgi:hypothetical protein
MTTTDTSLTMPATAAAASRYQRLRSHLAALKLPAAAEALPTVLDAAAAEQLSLTAALERLLAIEVDATEARRLAGRLRFACLPTPATLVIGRSHGIKPSAVQHQLYGTVNSFPRWVWALAAEALA